MESLEPEFCKSFVESGLFIVLGQRNSGKTTFLLACLKAFLDNNVFEKYYCILPAYKTEINDKYAFLKKVKVSLTVFSEFDEMLPERIIDEAELETKRHGRAKKSCLLMDDMTAARGLFYLKGANTSPLIRLLTTLRHTRCSAFLALHAKRAIIHPVISESASWVFLTTTGSLQTLKGGWDGWFRIRYTWKEFLESYNRHVAREGHHILGLFVDDKKKRIDENVFSWGMIKSRIE